LNGSVPIAILPLCLIGDKLYRFAVCGGRGHGGPLAPDAGGPLADSGAIDLGGTSGGADAVPDTRAVDVLANQPSLVASVAVVSVGAVDIGKTSPATAVTITNVGSVAGTLTVDKATLTITANSLPKTYGAVTTFAGTEFTTIGLVNGDTVTSVSLSSSGAVATATVGPYNIVPSNAVGTGLGNYNISYLNGTLSVGAANLSITASNRSKTPRTSDDNSTLSAPRSL